MIFFMVENFNIFNLELSYSTYYFSPTQYNVQKVNTYDYYKIVAQAIDFTKISRTLCYLLCEGVRTSIIYLCDYQSIQKKV